MVIESLITRENILKIEFSSVTTAHRGRDLLRTAQGNVKNRLLGSALLVHTSVAVIVLCQMLADDDGAYIGDVTDHDLNSWYYTL